MVLAVLGFGLTAAGGWANVLHAQKCKQKDIIDMSADRKPNWQ